MSLRKFRWKCFLAIAYAGINVLFTNVAYAQIKGDRTLEINSKIIKQGDINIIEGGTTAGNNLFHSFKEFSVPLGNEAHFNNAVDISNIITRVTGKSVSNIDGLIKANGSANLFLINPNGIVFGENAQLNIGGSFVGSTADSLKFDNDIEFSANDAQTKPLLSVNVPLGLQFGKNPGGIRVQGIDSKLAFTQELGLKVLSGKTLALIGGNLDVENGFVKAPGGRIEFGSVADSGGIDLKSTLQGWTFNYQDIQDFGNINLSKSFVDIAIKENFSPEAQSKGSGIFVRASQLNMEGTSIIRASNFTSAPGGNVNINVQKLTMQEGATISTSAFSKGLGGDLIINATESVELAGTTPQGLFPTALSTSAFDTGDAGELTINTPSLLVEGGAQISTSTLGKGEGGNLNVNAANIEIIGTGNNGEYPSALFSSAQTESTGNGGNLTINTNSLKIEDGASIATDTYSTGKGGRLEINARNIELKGTSDEARLTKEDVLLSSGLFARVLEIEGATGNGGDLIINAGTFVVKEGAEVKATTSAAGDGGRLQINARNLQVIGTGQGGLRPSAITVSADKNSTGNAGNSKIITDILQIEGGALISAGTFGKGDAGNLNIDATDINVIGTGNNGLYPSGLFASAEPESTGNGGNIIINTNNLTVEDGALIGAGTHSVGKGGNVEVNAQNIKLQGTNENVRLTEDTPLFNSGLFARVRDQEDATGNGGDVNIKTDTLLVQDNAQLAVNSLGAGSAGNLQIDARSIQLNNNASLSANTPSNKADLSTKSATISINSKDLIMRRGSNITTNASGEDVVGGNINIDTDILAAFENSDISANSKNFRGGRVRIEAQGIFGTQFRSKPTPQSDITASGAREDLSGNVEIINPENNPTDDLVELPTTPTDTQLAQSCTASSSQAQSKFEITGRGGLPILPNEALNPDAVSVDLVTLNPNINNTLKPVYIYHKASAASKKIVEATGWIQNQKGEIFFVADSDINSRSSWYKPDNCNTVKSN